MRGGRSSWAEPWLALLHCATATRARFLRRHTQTVGATMTITRRAALLGALASPAVLRHARAATVVKMGVLKLIHSITPYFYERFTPEGTTIADHAVREPGGRQGCGGRRHGRFRDVRRRRLHPVGDAAPADRGDRVAVQQGHGDRGGEGERHRQADRPERQAGRDLARLDAGGVRAASGCAWRA